MARSRLRGLASCKLAKAKSIEAVKYIYDRFWNVATHPTPRCEALPKWPPHTPARSARVRLRRATQTRHDSHRKRAIVQIAMLARRGKSCRDPGPQGQLLKRRFPQLVSAASVVTARLCGGARRRRCRGGRRRIPTRAQRAAHKCDGDSDFAGPACVPGLRLALRLRRRRRGDPRVALFGKREAVRLCEVRRRRSGADLFIGRRAGAGDRVWETVRGRRGLRAQKAVPGHRRYHSRGFRPRSSPRGYGRASFSSSRETLWATWISTGHESRRPSNFDGRCHREVGLRAAGGEIPYEAQEPINFLHYKVGIQYKPHTDSAGRTKGKRVAAGSLLRGGRRGRGVR